MKKLPEYTNDEIREHRIQFVHELETTKKLQGAGKLKDNLHQYCCLGVCAKMINPKIKINTKSSEDEFDNAEVYHLVDNFLGLNDGIISRDMFMLWNDEDKFTFKKIADKAKDGWSL